MFSVVSLTEIRPGVFRRLNHRLGGCTHEQTAAKWGQQYQYAEVLKDCKLCAVVINHKIQWVKGR